MAEIASTVSQVSAPNDLSSATYETLATVLAADGDTTAWVKVFEEFSWFVKGGTTYSLTIQVAFKADKSDAFDLDLQEEDLRGANYEFTGYLWVRAARAAADAPITAILSYRKD